MSKVIKADSYGKQTIKRNNADYTYYTAKNDKDEILGYIFSQKSVGYNGDVSVMVGLNPDGTVKAVEILDASGETPGLGQRVTEKEFLSQFSGKPSPFGETAQVITGATYSSKAVISAVDTSCELFATLKGGAENE